MSRSRPLRIAVLSSLYPNSQQPRHGIFVEERLRHLVATGEVEAQVVAPVPWFFSTHPRFGQYARLAAVPPHGIRSGIRVQHPRYVVVPKIGMTLGPMSMARAAALSLSAMRKQGFDFDLIDAHYVYPDGVAAAALSRRFDRPVVITARGADINTIADMKQPQRQIRRALRVAEGVVTVSASLADKIRHLDMRPKRLETLRNGVDLDRFRPIDRDVVRLRLDVSARVWLCVGHLIERKGMHIAIDALAQVDDVTLLIAGDGPEEAALRRQAQRLGVSARVRFLGPIGHNELASYYNAADALILASRSEGMPNVLLESLACGTAVIANPVDGIPEIMTDLIAGRLISRRDGAAVAQAWRSLADNELDAQGRAARRRFAEQFGWQATTEGQLAMFDDILTSRHSRQGRQ